MKDIPKIQRVSQAATSRSRKNTWLAVASPIHPFLCGPQRLERSGQLFTVTWLDAGSSGQLSGGRDFMCFLARPRGYGVPQRGSRHPAPSTG